MSQTSITIVGNAVTDVTVASTATGVEYAVFRIATTARRFDRSVGQWVDGDTSFMRVTCWRRLARGVAESIVKGDPLVVTGVLRVREWATEDRRGVSVEIDASAVGHDLARGVSAFTRAAKRDPLTLDPAVDQEVDLDFQQGGRANPWESKEPSTAAA
ncbi:MAG TPA: single-stranded DNA-binding protein [Actinobacteria bacterium]|nr:single-stranded DNA-binding protein [Actinomycetota bacterium]